MKKFIFAPANRKIDLALLILRLGIGIDFLFHGYPKIIGGKQMWIELGGAMQNIGIHAVPGLWGFLAALAEFGGAILLLAGLCTRVAASAMFFTMLVAMVTNFQGGYGFSGASSAIEMSVVFLFLMIVGAGKYSLDGQIQKV